LIQVGDCNLDAFIGHTSEALVFCSNFLKSGTATKTATVTTGATTIIQTTTYVTLYPPTTSSKVCIECIVSQESLLIICEASDYVKAHHNFKAANDQLQTTSTDNNFKQAIHNRNISYAVRIWNTLVVDFALTVFRSASAGCGLVGYTKDTAAYYFDSSGTKNTFATCSAACKADAQCKSFGYGEANCMLFTVDA